MSDTPLIIEERPRGIRPRASGWLRSRRFFLAGSLALAEVVAFLVWRPGSILAVLAAALVLALSTSAAMRLGPGVLRDVLWIVAIAQGLVVVVPVAVGFSLAIGLIAAVVILVAVVVLAFRLRV